MVRFELLFPLYYNDGRLIEKEKFLQTDEELVGQFGATSTDSVVVSGRWVYQSTLYEDKLIGCAWMRKTCRRTGNSSVLIKKF
jgi:hypothetical protein